MTTEYLPYTSLTPFNYKHCSEPMIRNNDDIIIAVEAREEGRGLYKYDNIHDIFTEFIKYPSEFRSIGNTACIDQQNDIIYIPSSYDTLLKIHLKSKQIESIHIDLDSHDKYIEELLENNPKAIILNNQLNIFGTPTTNIKRNYHLIYDNKIQKYRIVKINRSSPFNRRIVGHCMFHMKSQNKLLLMGGRNAHTIRQYNILKDEWSICNTTLPHYYPNVGHVMTPDEKWIIVLGGSTKSIYIMNTEIMKFDKLQTIRCPEPGSFRAFLVDNYQQTDMIINGYIRRVLGLKQFCGTFQFPNELSNLLFCFYREEYVHMIEYGEYKGGTHYKISLNAIFQDMDSL